MERTLTLKPTLLDGVPIILSAVASEFVERNRSLFPDKMPMARCLPNYILVTNREGFPNCSVSQARESDGNPIYLAQCCYVGCIGQYAQEHFIPITSVPVDIGITEFLYAYFCSILVIGLWRTYHRRYKLSKAKMDAVRQYLTGYRLGKCVPLPARGILAAFCSRIIREDCAYFCVMDYDLNTQFHMHV